MIPDEFERILREGIATEAAQPGSGIRFTNGKDLTEVILPQYRSGFLRLMGGVQSLHYRNLGWGDTEVRQLCEALSYVHTHGEFKIKMNPWDIVRANYNSDLAQCDECGIPHFVAPGETCSIKLLAEGKDVPGWSGMDPIKRERMIMRADEYNKKGPFKNRSAADKAAVLKSSNPAGGGKAMLNIVLSGNRHSPGWAQKHLHELGISGAVVHEEMRG